MASCCMGTLLPELVIIVMTSLDSPRDLFAFIQTSSRNYQVFQASKRTVLEGVIRNAIVPSVLPDALAACDAGQVSELWQASLMSPSTHTSNDGVNDKVQTLQTEFVRNYVDRHSPRSLSGNDARLIRSLYRLWWTTDYFLADFRDCAFRSAVIQNVPAGTSWNDSLSRTEIMRLQRAFFRFETYRRLFPNTARLPSRTGADDRLMDDHLMKTYLQIFSRPELEEIVSIHEYLVDVVHGIYRRLQDYVVASVHKFGQQKAEKCEQLKIHFKRERSNVIGDLMDLTGFDVFQQFDSSFPRRIQYIVARGLPFIRWFQNLEFNDGIRLVSHCTVYTCKPTIFEKILDLERNPLKDRSGERDHFGWRWVSAHGLTSNWVDLLKRHSLRKMGYIFWSTERLRVAWQFKTIIPEAFDLTERRSHDDGAEEPRPSIQKKFRNVLVPKNFFNPGSGDVSIVFEPSEFMKTETESITPIPFTSPFFDFEY